MEVLTYAEIFYFYRMMFLKTPDLLESWGPIAPNMIMVKFKNGDEHMFYFESERLWELHNNRIGYKF